MCFLIELRLELSKRNEVTATGKLVILVTTIALRLALPVSVPAALLCTHLTMHDFGVPDSGVAVIRMGWFGWLLRADLMVRVPSAEFVLGYTGVTSFTFQSESSAARLWLLLRASLKWSKVGIQGHVFLVNSAHFIHRYTVLACLAFCTQGVATNWRLLGRTSLKWSGLGREWIR